MKAQARIHVKMNPLIAKKYLEKKTAKKHQSLSIISRDRRLYPYLKRIPRASLLKKKNKNKNTKRIEKWSRERSSVVARDISWTQGGCSRVFYANSYRDE